jgi:hypothetical protein
MLGMPLVLLGLPLNVLLPPAYALKNGELPSQIGDVSTQCVIAQLSANCANQPCDKRMRSWTVRNTLNLIDLQDTKVRFPSLILEQRIAVGAELLGLVGTC